MTAEGQDRLLDWLLKQGVPTLLLCAILGFMGYQKIVLDPAHTKTIQDGYEQNATTLSKSLEAIAASHDRDREMWIKMCLEREK